MKALLDTLVCLMMVSDTSSVAITDLQGASFVQCLKGYVVIQNAEYNPLTGGIADPKNIVQYLGADKQPIALDYCVWMTYIKRRKK